MFAAIANTFSNCFKIPELKSRILFTFMLLAICRLEAIIRIPGLNGNVLAEFFKTHAAQGASVLGMYSLFTGGALERCAIGSLGIMPYISATIIIQLLTAVRSEEHTSELQSHVNIVCRLLLEKKIYIVVV